MSNPTAPPAESGPRTTELAPEGQQRADRLAPEAQQRLPKAPPETDPEPEQ